MSDEPLDKNYKVQRDIQSKFCFQSHGILGQLPANIVQYLIGFAMDNQ